MVGTDMEVFGDGLVVVGLGSGLKVTGGSLRVAWMWLWII